MRQRLSQDVAMEKLVAYLRERSRPTYSRRWLFLKRRDPARYLFPIRAGASDALLNETSLRLGLVLPDDFRSAYALMDGMEDYTGTDAGFMRLLPLSEWKFLRDEMEADYDPSYGRNVIVSDYSIWAWWYAIELENPSEIGWVRCFGGGSTWLVAQSFDTYLELTLADDPILYGPREGGAAA